MNEERTVLTAQLPHRPGEPRSAHALADDAGVNIDALYVLRSNAEGIEFAISIDQADEAMPELPPWLLGGRLLPSARCCSASCSSFAGSVPQSHLDTGWRRSRPCIGTFVVSWRPTPRRAPTTTSEPTTTAPTTTLATTTSEAPTTSVASRFHRSTGCRSTTHLLDRRLLAVRSTTIPMRPQSGSTSPIWSTIRVEGITRFLTLWMQSDADFRGPMRSGRPTGRDTAHSPQHPDLRHLRGTGLGPGDDHLDEHQPPHRDDTPLLSGSRSAAPPNNLYTTTAGLRADADARDYEDLPPTGPSGSSGTCPQTRHPPTQSTSISSGPVSTGRGTRNRTGCAVPTGRNRIGAVRTRRGSYRLSCVIGNVSEQYSNNGLPSSHTTGTGQAWVFAGGKVVEGTWARRPRPSGTLTDADGNTTRTPGPGVDLARSRHRRSHLRVGRQPRRISFASMTAFDRVERASPRPTPPKRLNVFTHLDDEAAMDRAAGLGRADEHACRRTGRSTCGDQGSDRS